MHAATMSQNGKHISIGSSNNLYHYNGNGELLWILKAFEEYQCTKSLATTPDGSRIAVGLLIVAEDYDNTMYFIDRNGNMLGEPIKNRVLVFMSLDGKYVLVYKKYGRNSCFYDTDHKKKWSLKNYYGSK